MLVCVELLNVGSGVKASRRQHPALVNPIRGSGSIRPQQISHQQIPLQNKHLYNGRRVKTKKLVGEMSGPPSVKVGSPIDERVEGLGCCGASTFCLYWSPPVSMVVR